MHRGQLLGVSQPPDDVLARCCSLRSTSTAQSLCHALRCNPLLACLELGIPTRGAVMWMTDGQG